MRPIVLAMLGLAATCAAPAWGLDINGNTIGMPIDQVAKPYGKRWTCDTAKDARAGDQICRKSKAVDEFPRMQNEYFARNHVAIFYRFHDDRLVQIRVSGIAKSRFDDILDTLKKSYGEPRPDGQRAGRGGEIARAPRRALGERRRRPRSLRQRAEILRAKPVALRRSVLEDRRRSAEDRRRLRQEPGGLAGEPRRGPSEQTPSSPSPACGRGPG